MWIGFVGIKREDEEMSKLVLRCVLFVSNPDEIALTETPWNRPCLNLNEHHDREAG